jgi:hypothetical protein
MNPAFDAELLQLSERASASRIASLTKLAMANGKCNKFVTKVYKEVVFALEKFMHKTTNKLTGLYLIDSICRASLKLGPSSLYVKRIGDKLDSILVYCLRSSEKDKEKMKRLLALWKENGVFPPAIFDSLDSSLLDSSDNIDKPTEYEVAPPSAQSSPLKPSALDSLNSEQEDFSSTTLRTISPQTFASNASYTPIIAVGSLLTSVIHGATQVANVPTMDQLNTMLNIPAPSAPVARDPSNFDYEEEDFIPKRKSVDLIRT